MCLLGCDVGSSSVKASIVDEETGQVLASDFYPKEEASIKAIHPGGRSKTRKVGGLT